MSNEMDEVIAKIPKPPKPKGLSAEALYPGEIKKWKKEQLKVIKTALKTGTPSRYTLGQAIIILCGLLED